MIKQIFTTILFAAFLQTAAQDSTEITRHKKEITQRFYVSLEAGPSFPLGDFGDRNLQNENSGLALTGLGARLKAGFGIRNHFWVVASGVYFYNPLDAKTLLNSITSDPRNPPELKYKVETDAWKIYGAMAGLAARFDLDQTDCELRGMIGIVNGTYASARYSATDGVVTEYIDETADDVLSPAIDLGISFRLKISNSVGVSISGDLFITQLDFDNIIQTRDDGEVFDAGEYSQPVSVFQLLAGVYFKF